MPLTRIVEFMRLFAQLELARKEPGHDKAIESQHCARMEVIWETMTFDEQEAVEYVLRSDLPLVKTKTWKAEHLMKPMDSVSMGCTVGKDVCQLCVEGPSTDLHVEHHRKIHVDYEPKVFSAYEHVGLGVSEDKP